MEEIDRKILVETEKGIPLTSQPFDQIALKIGVSRQEVILRLQNLQRTGVVRRFGVSVKPDGVGYSANALVAWKVPQNRLTEVADYFCKFKEVSHCYEREVVPGKWEYNLYTVMHAQNRSTFEEMVQKHACEVALNDFVILYSTRNLKENKKC